MAISTYPVALKYNSGTAQSPEWTDVCPIKNFPDLGGAPDMLETTTLADASRKYISGIKDTQQLQFTANYDPDDFDDINAMTGTKDFQLWFGSSGASGKYQFSGEINVYVAGAGVNEVVEMIITITPSTEITVVS